MATDVWFEHEGSESLDVLSSLEFLISDEFEDQIGPNVPAPLLRQILSENEHVKRLRHLFEEQILTDRVVQEFVTRLVEQFRLGERFPYDLALSAIAVVVETHSTLFSDDYIETLSCLKFQELPLSPRVARLCLDCRLHISVEASRWQDL